MTESPFLVEFNESQIVKNEAMLRSIVTIRHFYKKEKINHDLLGRIEKD